MNKATKQANTKHASNAMAHRIVVRGYVGKQYKRRVKVVRGTYEEAMKFADSNINKLSKGMKQVFVNVFNGAKGSGYVEHK